MIISPSRNFVFIHLEKCGGTSVESALQPYLHWSDLIIGSTEFGERYQQCYYDRYGIAKVHSEMLWKHSTAKDIHAFITPDGWRDFKRISIVRDPQEIIKSLYFFSQTSVKYHLGRINREKWKELLRTKIFPQQYPYTEGYIHAYAQSEIEGSGIDGFVKNVLSNNYHFVQPQTHRLEIYPGSDLGMVKDLSRLNDEWHEILDALFIEDRFEIKKLNKSERDFKVELSDKSKKIIKKHFSVDYQTIPKYTGVEW